MRTDGPQQIKPHCTWSLRTGGKQASLCMVTQGRQGLVSWGRQGHPCIPGGVPSFAILSRRVAHLHHSFQGLPSFAIHSKKFAHLCNSFQEGRPPSPFIPGIFGILEGETGGTPAMHRWFWWSSCNHEGEPGGPPAVTKESMVKSPAITKESLMVLLQWQQRAITPPVCLNRRRTHCG